jgi:hypothetical protein
VDNPYTSMAAGTRPTAILVASLKGEMARAKDTLLSSFFSDVLFIQGRVEDAPISDDEPTILGEVPLQREARQRLTGAVTFSVITRPENGTPYNPYPRTRHLKQERLLTTGHSTSVAIPDVAIIATPRSESRNERSVMPGTNVRTRPFSETCFPTLPKP